MDLFIRDCILSVIIVAIIFGPYLISQRRKKGAEHKRVEQRKLAPKCVLMAQDYDGRRTYGTPPIGHPGVALQRNILEEAAMQFHMGEERVVVYDEAGTALYTIMKGERWQ